MTETIRSDQDYPRVAQLLCDSELLHEDTIPSPLPTGENQAGHRGVVSQTLRRTPEGTELLCQYVADGEGGCRYRVIVLPGAAEELCMQWISDDLPASTKGSWSIVKAEDSVTHQQQAADLRQKASRSAAATGDSS